MGGLCLEKGAVIIYDAAYEAYIQKIMWPIRFMSATVRTDVPSSFEAFPMNAGFTAHVLVSQLFLRRLSAAM